MAALFRKLSADSASSEPELSRFEAIHSSVSQKFVYLADSLGLNACFRVMIGFWGFWEGVWVRLGLENGGLAVFAAVFMTFAIFKPDFTTPFLTFFSINFSAFFPFFDFDPFDTFEFFPAFFAVF